MRPLSPSPSPCTQAAFEALLLPLARAFEPQLVIVFGGMDAAEGDATGNCSLSAAGAHMRISGALSAPSRMQCAP